MPARVLSRLLLQACLLFALISSAALPAPAQGQPSCSEQEKALLEQASPHTRFQVVALLSEVQCLGEKRDEAKFTSDIEKLLGQAPNDIDKRKEMVAATLDAIIEHANGINAGIKDSPLPILVARLNEAKKLLDSVHPVTYPGSWEFDGQQLILNSTTAFPLDDYLSRHCENASDKSLCPQAYETAKNAVRVSMLAARALSLWRNDEVKDALARVKVLDKKWDAYFNDARSQYLWELWGNGKIVEKWYPLAKLPGGLAGGFREVPNWQLILAHPGLALEYVEGAADGSEQRESAVLEVLGANRWSYKADGSMGWAFGAALIFAVSDRAGASEEAWGVLVHVNNRYSFGATRHDGDTGYLISADFAKLWTKASEKWKNKISREKS